MALFLLDSGGLHKGIFFSLFTSCWSLGSDPHGGGGEELAGRDHLSKHKSIQYKSCFGSSPGDLVILRLQARITITREMNCTEVPIFTKGFGFTVNCCPQASSCGPIGYGMGIPDSAPL